MTTWLTYYLSPQRDGAAEAFRGFINLLDDYLAPELMRHIQVPSI